MPRHKWVKLRLHVYICRTCGTGKVNSVADGEWKTTYCCPDGSQIVSIRVPPCERGAHTLRYLEKYAAQIIEAIY